MLSSLILALLHNKGDHFGGMFVFINALVGKREFMFKTKVVILREQIKRRG